MYLILYNPISRNGANTKVVEKIVKKMKKKHEQVEVQSLLDIKDTKEFLKNIDPNTKIVLVGGDGTLNRIANEIRGIEQLPEVYLYKAGTGNDFRRSIKTRKKLARIDQYLVDLPTVNFKDHNMVFLNGIGLGFDALVCHTVEESKKKKNKLNFFASVFRSLKNFQPFDFEVEIDGVKRRYEDAWFVSIMNSKFFGGGMRIAPKANRESNTLEVVIISGISKLKLSILFPLIYLGWHTIIKNVQIFTGKEIKVYSDYPSHIQIDGEVFNSVLEIDVKR
ncbi:MAG: diacylglycerol/lipid kinase family protein [Acholeplasmataceae bacterium]|jgi:YegS/Rv2252/BmrU family lipid kinase